jgi:hypothetical protein
MFSFMNYNLSIKIKKNASLTYSIMRFIFSSKMVHETPTRAVPFIFVVLANSSTEQTTSFIYIFEPANQA